MDLMKETLQKALPEIGMSLNEKTADTLCAFGAAVVRQNEVMNLTAITEPDRVARLHLLDSLTVAAAVDLQGKKLIDVGCGAGFPGVPIAIACPDTKVTLLDSLGKRVKWLEETLPTLGVEAECVIARAEEAVASRRESYDVATSRAVARLNILLELTAPYVKVGGFVVAMKGAAAEEELAECTGAMKKLGLKLRQIRQFPVEDTCHNLLIFEKIAHTPPAYPRRYAKIKASPL